MLQKQQLDLIAARIEGCSRCVELSQFRCENDYWPVPGEGRPNARVMFIGEAPGESEAQTGRPFVGVAGQMLEDMLAAVKWTRDQVFIANILKCRPPDNRDPHFQEAKNCRGFLDLQIKVVNPSHIVCLGKVAALNLLYTDQIPEIWFSKSLESLRGTFHDFQGRRVLCTYHPSFLCRTPAAHAAAYKDLRMLVDDLIALHSQQAG